MRKINDSKGNLLCIVYKDEDWVEGLNFITHNSLFIQVGSWWYQNGKNLSKHKHNIVSREANITGVKKSRILGSCNVFKTTSLPIPFKSPIEIPTTILFCLFI